MRIEQKKIKGKTDSFFYDGLIATHKKKNGTELELIATGHITININGERFCDGHIQDAIEQHKLTNRKLRELEKKGKLEWIENNWFDVGYKLKNESSFDFVMGDVAYSYDGGIELLKYYMKDKEF